MSHLHLQQAPKLLNTYRCRQASLVNKGAISQFRLPNDYDANQHRRSEDSYTRNNQHYIASDRFFAGVLARTLAFNLSSFEFKLGSHTAGCIKCVHIQITSVVSVE